MIISTMRKLKLTPKQRRQRYLKYRRAYYRKTLEAYLKRKRDGYHRRKAEQGVKSCPKK